MVSLVSLLVRPESDCSNLCWTVNSERGADSKELQFMAPFCRQNPTYHCIFGNALVYLSVVCCLFKATIIRYRLKNAKLMQSELFNQSKSLGLLCSSVTESQPTIHLKVHTWHASNSIKNQIIFWMVFFCYAIAERSLMCCFMLCWA